MKSKENKRDKCGLYFNEYTVFDSRLAEVLISTGKYLWYKEERDHWRTKKPMECYVFEYTDTIKEDMEIAKKKVIMESNNKLFGVSNPVCVLALERQGYECKGIKEYTRSDRKVIISYLYEVSKEFFDIFDYYKNNKVEMSQEDWKEANDIKCSYIRKFRNGEANEC